MGSFLLDDSRAWDIFISRATITEFSDLYDTLPESDSGNYRRVCIEVALGDYQSALELLETNAPLFEQQGFGRGLHALVRQRLGLPVGHPEESTGPTFAEDKVYAALAWAMQQAPGAPAEAQRYLQEALRLATEAGMQNTIEVIETVQHNLSDPHLGLPLVAPAYELLASPQAFDKLREDKHAFEKLAALGQMYLDPLQKCRYAQYLLYSKQDDAALEIIEQANPDSFLLAYAVKMAILSSTEKFDELGEMVKNFKPGSSNPLEAEGTMLGYEMCANFYASAKKDYPLSYAYWYRAEALAIEHGLNYRLKVICMNIEATANMAGDNLNLDPIYQTDTGAFKLKSIRNRFDSLLRAGNLQAIEELVKQNSINKEDYFVAQATQAYARFIAGEGDIAFVAKLITNYEPSHSESKLYWALLMLQIFGYIGKADGRANPERIYKVLENALSEIDQVKSVIQIAANLYPLGLSIASKLHLRLSDADTKAAILWSEHHRDGIRRDGQKLVTITRPIREALILDEVYGTREHYEAATHYQTGHPENKARLERSLNEAGLKRHEIATIGGVYRGLLRLGKTLDDRTILKHSETVLASSVFLQAHVVPTALDF